MEKITSIISREVQRKKERKKKTRYIVLHSNFHVMKEKKKVYSEFSLSRE